MNRKPSVLLSRVQIIASSGVLSQRPVQSVVFNERVKHSATRILLFVGVLYSLMQQIIVMGTFSNEKCSREFGLGFSVS